MSGIKREYGTAKEKLQNLIKSYKVIYNFRNKTKSFLGNNIVNDPPLNA